MNWLDNVLQTASDIGLSVADAWGQAQVAQYTAQTSLYDAQTQPVVSTQINYGALAIIGGVALVALLVVLKK